MDRRVPKVRLLPWLVAAGLALAVAGCGDSDGDVASEATPGTSDSATAGGATTTDPPTDGDGEDEDAAPPSPDSVVIEGFTFQPPSLEVPVGTTVTWTNEDSVPHTVTAGRPDEEVTGFHEPVDGGGTVQVAFDEVGTFPYYCVVHPTMTGEVVVS